MAVRVTGWPATEGLAVEASATAAGRPAHHLGQRAGEVEPA